MRNHSKNSPKVNASPYGILTVPEFIDIVTLPDNTGKDSFSRESDDLCILLLLDGTLSLLINDETKILHPEDTVLINANRHYEIKAECTSHFYMILINPILFQNSVSLPSYIMELINPSSPSCFILNAEGDDAVYIAHLIKDIVQENKEGSIPSRLKAAGDLHLILARFLICMHRDLNFKPENNLPSYNQHLNQMLEYIHENFQSKIQLDDIASAGHVSRSRCSPLFRKYLNMTPIEYLNNYRLEVSCNYLKNRNMSIASVANACGFSGQSYYTKLFVRKYGCTPREYRSNCARLATF